MDGAAIEVKLGSYDRCPSHEQLTCQVALLFSVPEENPKQPTLVFFLFLFSFQREIKFRKGSSPSAVSHGWLTVRTNRRRRGSVDARWTWPEGFLHSPSENSSVYWWKSTMEDFRDFLKPAHTGKLTTSCPCGPHLPASSEPETEKLPVKCICLWCTVEVFHRFRKTQHLQSVPSQICTSMIRSQSCSTGLWNGDCRGQWSSVKKPV